MIYLYIVSKYIFPGWIYFQHVYPINNNLEKLFELTDEVVIIKMKWVMFLYIFRINQIGSLFT